MSTLANFNIAITVPEGVLPPTPADLGANYREGFRSIANFFERLAAGMEPGQPGETKVAIQKGSTAAAFAYATQTVTFSGASGTVGAVINGITKTASHGASDTADAAALVAAVLADTTLNKLMTASNVAGVVTLTALQPGVAANGITVAASGTGVTAGAARLAGGVGGDAAATTISF